ncbi:MAG TPA: hypothetical protein PKC65_01055 [Pyrinomonadaceae bacterium]|nr:hypothetical protein [Pyrinomonadaceae bacterium]
MERRDEAVEAGEAASNAERGVRNAEFRVREELPTQFFECLPSVSVARTLVTPQQLVEGASDRNADALVRIAAKR